MRVLREGPLWAVIPVKPFDEAKTRLKPVLADAPRSLLAARLLRRTLLVLSQVAGIDVLAVTSRDRQALSIAREAGVLALEETVGRGLNFAVRLAQAEALKAGADGILIVASDLPLLSPSDVRLLLDASSQSGIVLAPDRHLTGTNALLLRPPDALATAFGIGSYQRHLALARAAAIEPCIIRTEGLGFDLDVPTDYEDLHRLAPREWDHAALVAG